MAKEKEDEEDEALRALKAKMNLDEDSIEEISTAGGVGGGVGSVEGGAGPHNKKRKRKPETLIREDDIIPEEEEIMQVDREQYIEEQKLRKLIRKGISVIMERRAKEKQALLKEEQKLRGLIRDLIKFVIIFMKFPYLSLILRPLSPSFLLIWVALIKRILV